MIFIVCILSYFVGIISCMLYKFIKEKIISRKYKQETEIDRELLFECFFGEEQYKQWKNSQ